MGAQSARIGDQLRAAVSHAIKMLALEIDRQLRLSTPIDTGHARRNWISSVGEPNTQEAKDESARAAGLQAVLAYELSQGALWVANSVPYIRALNYGHSQQQPAGFVERAVDLALSTVRQKLAAAKSPVDFAGLQSEYRSTVGGELAGNVASAYSPLEGGD